MKRFLAAFVAAFIVFVVTACDTPIPTEITVRGVVCVAKDSIVADTGNTQLCADSLVVGVPGQ